MENLKVDGTNKIDTLLYQGLVVSEYDSVKQKHSLTGITTWGEIKDLNTTDTYVSHILNSIVSDEILKSNIQHCEEISVADIQKGLNPIEYLRNTVEVLSIPILGDISPILKDKYGIDISNSPVISPQSLLKNVTGVIKSRDKHMEEYEQVLQYTYELALTEKEEHLNSILNSEDINNPIDDNTKNLITQTLYELSEKEASCIYYYQNEKSETVVEMRNTLGTTFKLVRRPDDSSYYTVMKLNTEPNIQSIIKSLLYLSNNTNNIIKLLPNPLKVIDAIKSK